MSAAQQQTQAEYNLEELVNPYVVEKLTATYEKDEAYKELLKQADSIYKKLLEDLTDNQAELLEQYFEATVATPGRRDALTYIQGMKNMYNLSIILQSKQ